MPVAIKPRYLRRSLASRGLLSFFLIGYLCPGIRLLSCQFPDRINGPLLTDRTPRDISDSTDYPRDPGHRSYQLPDGIDDYPGKGLPVLPCHLIDHDIIPGLD